MKTEEGEKRREIEEKDWQNDDAAKMREFIIIFSSSPYVFLNSPKGVCVSLCVRTLIAYKKFLIKIKMQILHCLPYQMSFFSNFFYVQAASCEADRSSLGGWVQRSWWKGESTTDSWHNIHLTKERAWGRHGHCHPPNLSPWLCRRQGSGHWENDLVADVCPGLYTSKKPLFSPHSNRSFPPLWEMHQVVRSTQICVMRCEYDDSTARNSLSCTEGAIMSPWTARRVTLKTLSTLPVTRGISDRGSAGPAAES